MEILTPFPLSYLAWIGIFVVIPLVALWIFNFSYFKEHIKVFLLAIIGSIIFSFPWDFIAVKEQIWLFEEPYILGIWLAGLPLEDWLFFVLVTVLFTSVTLLFWKKWGNHEWYV